MKSYKLLFIILVIFLKTGTVLSNTDIFNVNNIEIEKKGRVSNDDLANIAIKKGFKKLINKILLEEDSKKLQELKFSEIKELVAYYKVSNMIDNDQQNIEKINYNISFDKDKVHNLFYKKGISYSEISDKELFILPVLKKNNQLFIYSQNYFYNKWNEVYKTNLIEFILPLENIEIIQNINLNKNNLLDIKLNSLFAEYKGKNLALVLIEDNNLKEEKIYFKTEIFGKSIVKNVKIKRLNLKQEKFNQEIIKKIKQEIINLIKLENLIDIRAPSFLKAKLKTKKGTNNLVELKLRLKKTDLIEKIFIQELNNDFAILKIKYLGKMDKMIKQLENQKIILNFIDEQWSITII